jgi:hypothetical protein
MVMEAYNQISKESWEAWQCVIVLEFLHGAPEWVMCDTIRVK